MEFGTLMESASWRGLMRDELICFSDFYISKHLDKPGCPLRAQILREEIDTFNLRL